MLELGVLISLSIIYYLYLLSVFCLSIIYLSSMYLKKVKVLVTQLCPTLCNPVECSLPGCSWILQARILEWVVILFSRASSQPKDWTWVSCVADRFFTVWATREALSIFYLSVYRLSIIYLPITYLSMSVYHLSVCLPSIICVRAYPPISPSLQLAAQMDLGKAFFADISLHNQSNLLWSWTPLQANVRLQNSTDVTADLQKQSEADVWLTTGGI